MKNLCEERLKNMLVIDKKENPQRIERVIKAEIFHILKNFFDISHEDLDLTLEVDSNGKYVLNMTCVSNTIKIAKCF